MGKIDPLKLKDLVFPFLGYRDEKVLIGPKMGEDAAVIDLEEFYLVVSSDPVTGAKKDIGFYSVNINANDIATMGAVPKYFVPVIMLKEDSDEKDLKSIMKDIDSACKDLKISVIGGHSEITPGLRENIVSASILGFIKKNEKIISSSGAKNGDLIILTKGAGIEGTSILANDFYDLLKDKIDRKSLERAKNYSSESGCSIEIVHQAENSFCTVINIHKTSSLFPITPNQNKIFIPFLNRNHFAG